MAIIGLTLDETWDFTCKDDKEDPTVWTLGVIDPLLLAQVDDELLEFKVKEGDDTTATKLKMNQRYVEVVRYGLKAVTNFKDAAGEDIPFKTINALRMGASRTLVHDATLKRIPAGTIKELAEEILAKNRLSAGEIKNSD